MLKQLMVLVLALGCPAQSNNKPLQSSLQRYKAEGFSVLLPQQPTTIPIYRPSKSPFEKQKTGRFFGSYDDGVVYLILSFDTPWP